MTDVLLQRCGHCMRFYLNKVLLKKCSNCESIGMIVSVKRVQVVELWGVYLTFSNKQQLARICTDESVAELLVAEYAIMDPPIPAKVLPVEMYNEL